VYPYRSQDKQEFLTIDNLTVPAAHQHLYAHLRDSQQLHAVQDFNKESLHIYSRKVLNMITKQEPGWEEMVPESVAKTINEKCLFGHPCLLDR